jgi:alanine dehydrogenase
MIVGIMKENRADENRVAMTPAGVEVMRQNGHTVLVEKAAGAASGFEDGAYVQMGAEIISTPEEVLKRSEMIMRVRDPHPLESGLPRDGQLYFAYLHLASSEALSRALIESGGICIAYETIQKADGSLPLLKPMGEVAGPMAIHEGAKYLEMAHGGHGVLLVACQGLILAR